MFLFNGHWASYIFPIYLKTFVFQEWSHLPDLAKIVYVYLHIHDSFFKKRKLSHNVTVRIHNVGTSEVDRSRRGCLVAADNIACLRKCCSPGQFFPVRKAFFSVCPVQNCGAEG